MASIDTPLNDIVISKQIKTDEYTLNAIKRYRAKNSDKMKEYNKQYHLKKKEEKHQANPYIKLTKTQLYEKIFELENKLKLHDSKESNDSNSSNTTEIEIKYKDLETKYIELDGKYKQLESKIKNLIVN